MFWSFLTTTTTDTHNNNANTSAQRNIYEESVFYDDFEPRKYTNNENQTTSTEYLILNGKRGQTMGQTSETAQKLESDGPIIIFSWRRN